MSGDTILNVAFGTIGVASFIYAVVANRKASSRRELVEGLTGDIRQLASVIVEQNRGTPTEGYARSIAQICNSLIRGKTATSRIGIVSLRYPSFLIPMRTEVGETVRDDLANTRYATRGERISEGVRYLTVGPHEKLPAEGQYRAMFSIRAMAQGQPPAPHTPVLDLNVYNYGSRKFLSRREVVFKDLNAHDYVKYELDFEYDDLETQLEYRTSITQGGVIVWCEDIRVFRMSD